MKHQIEGTKGILWTLYTVMAIVTASSFTPALAAYTPPITNRVDIDFNLNWKYRQGDASGASAKTFDDAAWTTVCVPHSTKWVTPEDKLAYLGTSWYRKHFTIDNAYQGRKVFVEFEAAMQYAEVRT